MTVNARDAVVLGYRCARELTNAAVTLIQSCLLGFDRLGRETYATSAIPSLKKSLDRV